MALPTTVKKVTLTAGPYSDFAGAPLRGVLTLTPSVRSLVWAATGTPLLDKPIRVSLESDGTARVVVPATDQTGFTAGGASVKDWTYRVELEILDGEPWSPFSIQLPQASPTVDLDALVPVQGSAGVVVQLPAVTSVNGLTGAVNLGTVYASQEDLVDAVSGVRGETPSYEEMSTAIDEALEGFVVPVPTNAPEVFLYENGKYQPEGRVGNVGFKSFVGPVDPATITGVRVGRGDTWTQEATDFPTNGLLSDHRADSLALVAGEALSGQWGDSWGTYPMLVTGGPVLAVTGGRREILFDGVNDYGDIALPTLAQPFTIVAVRRWATATPSKVEYAGIGSPSISVSTASTGYLNYSAGTNQRSTTTQADTAVHFVAIRFDGANSKYFVDGTVVSPSSSPGTASLLGGLRVAAGASLAGFSHLALSRLLVYNRALSDSEIATMRATAVTKYGTPA